MSWLVEMDYFLLYGLIELEFMFYNIDWELSFNILQSDIVQESRLKILFAERLSNVQSMHYQCFEALVFG